MSKILAYFRVNPREARTMHREVNREGLADFGIFKPVPQNVGAFYLTMERENLTALVKQITEEGTNLLEIDAHDVRLQGKVLTAPEDIRAATPDAGWRSDGSLKVKKRR